MGMSPIRSRWILLHGVLILAGTMTPAVRAGTILRVDDDAPGGGDGSSWNTAFRFLQDALGAAPPGVSTSILVAQGTYPPDRVEANPAGTGDRTATFNLRTGVEILGGYAGLGAVDPDARDIVQFTTVLSGDLAGDDGPPGSFMNNAENCRNVVTADGTDLSAVLDGCTVTGGNADGPNEYMSLHRLRGGGIWNGSGSPTIRNCRIEYNFALSRGGGMYNFTGTSPVLLGCTFRGNVCSGTGGGLRNFQCSATVTDCVFVDNSAAAGGGIEVYDSPTTTITGSIFCDNWPNHILGDWTDGGGNSFCPLCDESSGPVLEVPGAYPTIQSAINAACDGAEVVVSPGTYFETISFGGKNIIVRSTGGPEVTTLDGQGTSRLVLLISGEDVSTTLEGFTIANGSAELGGAIMIQDSSATIIDCHFRDNVADIGGAIRFASWGTEGQLNLLRCVFDGNQANIAGGALLAGDRLSAIDCVFTDNDGGQGPGAVGGSGSSTTYVNCLFAGNSANFVAGGVANSSNAMLMVNCVFSRNSAPMSGGLEAGAGGVVANCTFSLNQGGGVGKSSPLSNCILWGNTPVQIGDLSTVVEHSSIQGGWPGTGNIDADPLFVQPGTDDVRLAFGSPCVGAGSNAALPADTLDIDGDGNTTEPIPFDYGGGDRVQGAFVDMGAWEGEFEPGAPASSDNDLDQGDFAVLVPGGAPFNPLVTPAVIVTNTAGPDNASVVVTQLDGDMHPGAGGFAELGAIFRMVTTLADGEYLATVFIPFSAADLAGIELQQLNLTAFDDAMGNWAYASSANSQASPGFSGAIGNMIVVPAGGSWGLTQDVGDYGVFWDPQLLAGFVWANVDSEGDFAVGFALCPSDCLQTPDGVTGIQDLLVMLSLWGTEAGGGPCDIDLDGMIGMADFAAILDAWGPCVLSAAAGAVPYRARPGSRSVTARSPDLDGNGRVDAADLETLRTAWGPCKDCAADLDGDGRVDVRDMLALLRDWSAAGATRFGP